MRCSFLVAPHLCEEVSDGECRRHAAEPLIADRGKWPHRIDDEDPGVNCASIGSEECSDPDWTCSDVGACNAYEKTVRLCIPKLRMEPYDCWVNPNALSGEVRVEAPSFPAWWLAGGVVSVMFSLCACSGYLFLLREASDSKSDCCAKLVVHAIMNACIVGCVVGLVFLCKLVISLFTDDDGSSAVAKEVTLLDLATSMGIDLNATDALSGIAEPEVEGFPWGTVGIVAGSIVGGCCLICCCCALCAVLLGDGEEAREQAIAGNKCSADAFAVGSTVKLRSGVEGGNVVGGPLKLGDEAMVVKVDNCEPEPLVQVCFNGEYWFYTTGELEAASAAEGQGSAEGDLTRGVSDPCGKPTQSKSAFSLASRGSAASANISRKELARSVSATSTLSKKQVIGHAVLSGMEGQQQFYRGLSSKLVPASKVEVVASRSGISETRDRCIQAWSQEGFVMCPVSFKLKAGDPVRVDSSKENVERLCNDSCVTWNDEKAAYLGRDGSVMGADFVGAGVRVKFSDGHWWSYHPSCLWIHTEKLSPTRKEDFEKMATQVAGAA